ncbi:MAG TPA: hypothetical protein VHB21_22145, partial [Minicystis sp.]|nr:hypothetical protein [Minicystis sp.]
DLEELRGAPVEAPPVPAAGEPGGGEAAGEPGGAAPPDIELRQRLDALASSAARAEADLQAASWKIAQLERDLADARKGPRPAETVHDELEQALVAAREEVASLRRALSNETSTSET